MTLVEAFALGLGVWIFFKFFGSAIIMGIFRIFIFFKEGK